MVDISQHELVPKHTKLDDGAVKDVLQEHNVEKTNFPKIKLKDPTLPEDTEPDDIIKIVWNSRTTDKTVVYRLMIE